MVAMARKLGHTQSLAPPAEGDVHCCWDCARLAVYTGNGFDLRKPTPAELIEFMMDPVIVKGMAEVRAEKGRSGRS